MQRWRLILDRSGNGSFLVTGRKVLWVKRFGGGWGEGDMEFSSGCFYFLSEIRNIMIRVRMERGQQRSKMERRG